MSDQLCVSGVTVVRGGPPTHQSSERWVFRRIHMFMRLMKYSSVSISTSQQSSNLCNTLQHPTACLSEALSVMNPLPLSPLEIRTSPPTCNGTVLGIFVLTRVKECVLMGTGDQPRTPQTLRPKPCYYHDAPTIWYSTPGTP